MAIYFIIILYLERLPTEIRKKVPFNKEEINKLTFPGNIGTDHIRGSIDALITMVEYGGYERSYTGRACPVVKEMMRRFDEKMYFVFRNFPLRGYIPMLSIQLKQLQLRTNSGKCMIICLIIIKH